MIRSLSLRHSIVENIKAPISRDKRRLCGLSTVNKKCGLAVLSREIQTPSPSGPATLTRMCSLPNGIRIGKKWTIGKKLGEGGCASVYAIQEDDPIIGSVVIKCAKLPNNLTSKAKNDKEMIKIANTLNYERMLYKGILNDFKYGVKLPSNGYYGEEMVSGGVGMIRYLVMGRLDYDLRHYATKNCSKLSSATLTASISVIGNEILRGLEILHQKGYLFVDVKPDNFMIKKLSSSMEFTPTDELYFVDFGLAEKYVQYMSNGNERERTTRAGLAGTPSYASISLLEGYSPCRKDDLEALGYVLLSLCMEGRLPWDDARSNQECLRIKRDTDILALTRRLGSPQIGEFITLIRDSDPLGAPDYNSLRLLLSHIASSTHSSEDSTSRKAQRGGKKSSATPVSVPPPSPPPPEPVTSSSTSVRSKRKAASQTVKENIPTTENGTAKRRRSSPEKGPFSSTSHNAPLTPAPEEEDDDEEEEAGNTPVKSKTPIASGKAKDNWKERVVQTKSPFTASSTDINDLSALPDTPPASPSPQVSIPHSPSPQRQIKSSRKSSNSSSSRVPSTVVFTVKRCAAWGDYVGHRISIPFPSSATSSAASDGNNLKKSTRKKSTDHVVVTIGAIEECDHVFENDEFLSGRHAQIKVEQVNGADCIIRVKDLNSTNGTRRNGEDLPANRWIEVHCDDKLELGNTEFHLTIE